MNENGQMNGVSVEKKPTPEQIKEAVKTVEDQIAQVIGVTVRGLIASSPGVPSHILLSAIARSTGKMLSFSVSGPQNTIAQNAKAREDFRQSFADGVASVPILATPQQAAVVPVKG